MKPLLLLVLLAAPLAASDLAAGFTNPPAEARPRAYWLWLHGHTDKASITRDLEQMKRAGIAGLLHWDPGPGPSRYGTRATALPPSPLWMTAQWREALHHTFNEATRLGLEVSLSLSPGPNCGGPWITPQLSARKLVFSSTLVTGPTPLNQKLPLPDGITEASDYRDIAVFAAETSRAGHTRMTHEVSQIYPIADQANIELGNPWTDVTASLAPDGTLTWQVPPGMVRILRIGHASTGQRADYFRPEGAGLMADPMNPHAVEFNFKQIFLQLFETKPLPPSLKYVHCDSHEVYGADWTPALLDEFKRRRGYDARPWLPTLEGGNIESRARTNRFKADLDRTRSELMVENHYAKLLDLAHSKGLGFHSESGGPRVIALDALAALARNDIPMGEFWAKSPTHRVTEEERFLVKEIASAAHIYGRQWVGAEAFTSVGPHWEEDPASLKPDADIAFLEGANRLFLHTFTHSPEAFGRPGIEYFAGTHFNPNLTWWPQARAWTDYLARCQWMLSRGLFVADVLHYIGDQPPLYVQARHTLPSLGRGHESDFINTEALLTRATARNRRITLPDGMSYALLAIDPKVELTADVQRKLDELKRTGVPVTATPRLAIPPDFEAPSPLDAIHRRTHDADIYFVVNRGDQPIDAHCLFRVTGRAPELWDPATGARTRQRSFSTQQGRTRLPLHLAPHGSIFVVFPQSPTTTAPAPTPDVRPFEIAGPWTVRFEPNLGAPAEALFTKLESFTERPEPGIRYFSGQATYSTTFDAPSTGAAELDLGRVAHLAEVRLNGHALGVVWKPPFRIDITAALKPGPNTLEVTVANLWVNRLIGDELLPEQERITRTNMRKFTAQSRLLPSGLLGPVRVAPPRPQPHL